MGNYAKRNKGTEKQFDIENPPDPDEIIVHGLGDWARRRGHKLPAPCPENFLACSRWWREHMQEPESRNETYQAPVISHDGALRWECGYATRCRTTLLKFLDLSDADREFVLAATRDDGVFWHGETIEQFADVINEKFKMREIGIEEYHQSTLAQARRTLARMGMRPSGRHLVGKGSG